MNAATATNDLRRKALLFIASTAALCGLLFGYDTGVISGALLFLKKDFALSAFQQGVVTSAVLAGAAVGAGFSGRLTDHFGRRRMVIAVAITQNALAMPTAVITESIENTRSSTASADCLSTRAPWHCTFRRQRPIDTGPTPAPGYTVNC